MIEHNNFTFLSSKRFISFLIAGLFSILFVSSANAIYPSTITNPNFDFYLNNQAGDFRLDGMTNIVSTDTSILFIDPSFTYTSNWKYGDNSSEFNFGTGIRIFTENFFPEGAVVGANIYYDRKWTVNDNTYNQFGLGMEFLSDYIDARVNGFIPTDKTKSTSGKVRKSPFTTNAIHSSLGNGYESSFYGYNAEVGIRLPFTSNFGVARVYLGYDDYRSNKLKDVDTFKLKLAYRPISLVELMAQYNFDDEVLKTHWLFGVNVSIPIDWSEGRILSTQNTETAPRSRMHEKVIRH